MLRPGDTPLGRREETQALSVIKTDIMDIWVICGVTVYILVIYIWVVYRGYICGLLRYIY